MASIGPTNKLQLNWSDSTFFPWLNPSTVLDYFCNTNNPFYSHNCNNEQIKMQNVNPEQLLLMTGYEYQLHLSEPPLYIIRKVERKSPKEVVELAYYYVLNGVVYQAPDFLSLTSSRLQSASCHLQDALETIFGYYKYHPSKGYYWTFNQNEIAKKDSKLKTSTQFQRDRIDALLNEFTLKFPPMKFTQPNIPNQQTNPTSPSNTTPTQQQQQQPTIKTEAMDINLPIESQKSPIVTGPPEKKMKISRS